MSADVEHRRREHRKSPGEDSAHLFRGPFGGRRGGDDLGTGQHIPDSPATKLVDGGLEQPDDGPQRARDQVQLVLDDQVRRAQPGDRLAGHRGQSGKAAEVVPLSAARSVIKIVVPVPVPRAA